MSDGALCVLLEYITYIISLHIFGSLHVNFRLHILVITFDSFLILNLKL